MSDIPIIGKKAKSSLTQLEVLLVAHEQKTGLTVTPCGLMNESVVILKEDLDHIMKTKREMNKVMQLMTGIKFDEIAKLVELVANGIQDEDAKFRVKKQVKLLKKIHEVTK